MRRPERRRAAGVVTGVLPAIVTQRHREHRGSAGPRRRGGVLARRGDCAALGWGFGGSAFERGATEADHYRPLARAEPLCSLCLCVRPARNTAPPASPEAP